MRYVWGTPLVSWSNFWDTVKCHRMNVNGVNVLPAACHVDRFTGRVGGGGGVEKCMAKSPAVRHVWGTPLVSWSNFWDTAKCHRMNVNGVNVLPAACHVDRFTGRVGGGGGGG